MFFSTNPNVTGDEIHYVYVLIDPRNNEPFYVGRSGLPELRFQTHVKEGQPAWVDPRKKTKNGIVKSILNDGLMPVFKVLEITTRRYAPIREASWWEGFMRRGHYMTNKTFVLIDGRER